MILIAIIGFIVIGAVLIALAIVIKHTFLADVDLKAVAYRSPYKRTRAPKTPKPKKVKQPKVKKPKKVKEPRKVKEPVATIPTPSPAATDAQRLTKIKQVQHQIASVNSMIKNIDTQFQSGGITQEEYMQKKSFLAEKLGGLQAELDQLRS